MPLVVASAVFSPKGRSHKVTTVHFVSVKASIR